MSKTRYDAYQLEDFIQDEFFIDWVRKHEASHEIFWNDWIARNPSKEDLIRRAAMVISSIEVNPVAMPLTKLEITGMVEAIHYQTKQGHSTYKLYNRKMLQVAAIMVLCLGLLFIYRQVSQQTAEGYQQVNISSTDYEALNNSATTKLVRMEDGSLAILKPGAKLKFPKSFRGASRVVHLVGEAFFEVAHDTTRPFMVYGGDMVTKVLGTSFTVFAPAERSNFRVVVNTGKVKVSQKRVIDEPSNSVILMPNEELFLSDEKKLEKKKLTSPTLLSKDITEKEFSFVDRPLSEIIQKLERAYDVRIYYNKEQLGSTLLKASLSDLPLDEKVKLLCKAIDASCNFNNGNITIIKDNNRNQNIN